MTCFWNGGWRERDIINRFTKTLESTRQYEDFERGRNEMNEAIPACEPVYMWVFE